MSWRPVPEISARPSFKNKIKTKGLGHHSSDRALAKQAEALGSIPRAGKKAGCTIDSHL
jgi:hypothetical protein